MTQVTERERLAKTPKPPRSLACVYDGQQCVGFVLPRGKQGHEAFNREQNSLGVFTTAAAAANAVFDSATNEESAG